MDRTIGDWQRISNLGEGGFGVVSLWMNQSTKETIGKNHFFNKYLPVQALRASLQR